MRLNQLDSKEPKVPTQHKPDAATQAALKEMMSDMHRTMLKADTLMRKLEQIIEKY
jgi:hypothetical protein